MRLKMGDNEQKSYMEIEDLQKLAINITGMKKATAATLLTVYDRAMEHYALGRMDEAYVLFFRCFSIIEHLRASPKSTTLLEPLVTKLNEAMEKLQELTENIIDRNTTYDYRKKEEQEKFFDKLKDTVPESEDDGWINSKEFRSILFESPESLLVLDLRSKSDYDKCHIKHIHTVNIPGELLPDGLSFEMLKEHITDVADRDVVDAAWTFNNIVIIDQQTKLGCAAPQSDLMIVRNAMTRFYGGTPLKSSPRILNGGFFYWTLNYPNTVSAPYNPADMFFILRRETPRFHWKGCFSILEEDVVYPDIDNLTLSEQSEGPCQIPRSLKPSSDHLHSLDKMKRVIALNSFENKSDTDPTVSNPSKSRKGSGGFGTARRKSYSPTRRLTATNGRSSENQPSQSSIHYRSDRGTCSSNDPPAKSKWDEAPALFDVNGCSRMVPGISCISSGPVSNHCAVGCGQSEVEEKLPEMTSSGYLNFTSKHGSDLPTTTTTTTWSPSRLKSIMDYNNQSYDQDDPGKMTELISKPWINPCIDRSNKPDVTSRLIAERSIKLTTREELAYYPICTLRNLGNTCFLNAVVQCLCGIPHFVRYFTGQSYRMHRCNNPLSIAREFARLLDEMSDHESRVIPPRRFFAAVGKVRNFFANGNQHDSMEFLCYLMDALHDDLNVAPNRGKKHTSDDQAALSTKQFWAEHLRWNSSIIVDCFQGLSKSIIRCGTCGHESQKNEIFSHLCVSVTIDICDVSLTELLDGYFKTEVIDSVSGWICSKCDTKRACEIYQEPVYLPPVLIIQLKRNVGGFTKINKRIFFPIRGLSMSRYFSSSMNTYRGDHVYDLVAVCNHHGTSDAGHYTAYRRRSSNQNQWQMYDDSQHRLVEPGSVLSPDAYILFYVDRRWANKSPDMDLSEFKEQDYSLFEP